VRTWRRLQPLGASVVNHAVYALPDTAAAREDFQWLKAEIEAAGGTATIFAADSADGSDAALEREFRRAREAEYAALAKELEQQVRRITRSPGSAAKQPLDRFRQRLLAIEKIDFFSSMGRDRVLTLMQELSQRAPQASGPGRRDGRRLDRAEYAGRLWVTRPRPGVDRMSSAWLIRRFVDPQARFGFHSNGAMSARAVPFDMFNVEFGHHGERCTFETLCERFGVDGPAIRAIAGIVHDLDLKDSRFRAPEAGAVGKVIDGLQLQYADDDQVLLEQGIVLFESLYRSFAQSDVPAPRRGRRQKRPSAGRRR
jgi:hypothetical protein